MPNKHAAIKDLRKNERRAAINSRMKTHLRALDRHFNALLKEEKVAEAKEMMQKLQQALGKAAKNAVIHKNKASRRLSSIHRALKTATK
ncbi:30S ribosomal protein S20 [Patescibacteria group bacterium]|nr:30S ribosomal protein S20 [Patescibacteria group bacterium]